MASNSETPPPLPTTPATEPDDEPEVKRVNKRNNEASVELNRLLMFNTAYYIVFFAIIGLPIWYATTTTYRAALPFDEIEQLAASISSRLSLRVNIELVSLGSGVLSSAQLAELERKLTSQMATKGGEHTDRGLVFEFHVKARVATKDEASLANTFSAIEKLDNEFARSLNVSTLSVFLLDEKLAEQYRISTAGDLVHLNHLYLSRNDPVALSDHILKNYLHARELKETYTKKLDDKRKLPTKQELKVVNFDGSYEITFSLINEIPEQLRPVWNIDHCITNYFSRIVDQLTAYTNISLKSQVLLHTEFDVSLVKKKNAADSSSSSSFFFLRKADLSVMTNVVESRLGARVSDSSALEFVAYVPAKQPLYVLDDDHERKASAFLVPRWGGLFIYNANNTDTQQRVIDVTEAVKIFLTQFIDLMGIRLNKNSRQFERSAIYTSELFGYVLSKTLENQLVTVSTLKSLSSLLTRISSMVIEDEIATEIHIAVDSLRRSIKLAQLGRIDEAFHASKQAFAASEKAFFDKSLLEKLYFPEDQRFAIYIPLFIPIGLPVALSVKSLLAWRKSAKTKTD